MSEKCKHIQGVDFANREYIDNIGMLGHYVGELGVALFMFCPLCGERLREKSDQPYKE